MKGFLLKLRQFRFTGAFCMNRSARLPEKLFLRQRNPSVSHQPADVRERRIHFLPDFCHGMLLSVLQKGENHLTPCRPFLLGHGFFKAFRSHIQPDNRLRPDAHTPSPHFCRHHQTNGFSQRTVILLSHFHCQFNQVRKHSGVVFECGRDRLHFFRRETGRFCQAQHHAFLLLIAKRNRDPLSRLNADLIGNTIGESMRYVLMNDIHNDVCEHAFPSLHPYVAPFCIILFNPAEYKRTAGFEAGVFLPLRHKNRGKKSPGCIHGLSGRKQVYFSQTLSRYSTRLVKNDFR